MGSRRSANGAPAPLAEYWHKRLFKALRLKQLTVQLASQGDGVFVCHAGDEVHGFA